mgnify:CR=1 FL=1
MHPLHMLSCARRQQGAAAATARLMPAGPLFLVQAKALGDELVVGLVS